MKPAPRKNLRRLTGVGLRACMAAGMLVAGCSTQAPVYERPAAPVAAAFPSAAGASSPTAGDLPASDIAWSNFFRDERLKRLISLALANNRDLRVAVLNIEQARTVAELRHADQLPTVNAGISASRQPNSAGNITSVYSAGLAVTAYELDLFGRIKSLGDAALAQVLASEEARKAVQISLVASVATTHLALQADEELLRVTRHTLESREASWQLTRLRFDNGASSQIDLRQAESLLAAARVTQAQLARQRQLDQNALVLLIGQPLPDDLPPALPIGAPAGFPELPAGLPSEVLTRRPDVRQAEQLLIAANANIGAARAALFPRISLTGSVGRASNALEGLLRGGTMAWSLAPQLLQPIFDAGRNQANLKSAEVSRNIALAQYERAIQAAFREVADALAGRATLGQQLQAQQAQVQAEEDRLRLADLRFQNGASGSLELLDAQRSLFTAQQALVQVQAQQAQNAVALYRVLGGGWSGDR